MKIQRGFTLVEILVTVTVLALLVATGIPSFQNSLLRSKVRKTSDLISECISMAKSEALRRNVKIYFGTVGSALCIGTTSGGCDLRSEPLTNGVSVSSTQLVLSPFYGVPSPAPATFTVTYAGVTQTLTINRLGIITIGAMS